MTTTLVTFWELEENQFLARLRQGIEESKLIYTASQLEDMLQLENPEEIYWAIQKAITVFKTLNLNSKKHFKQVYCAQNNTISIDWKLSRLGYLLVLINCDSEHPLVAKAQIELIRNKMEW
jgi:hypothetical protein